jgi:YceI-like domain
MKKAIIAGLLAIGFMPGAFAQKYMTRTGKIIFDATTKSSPEKISGKNNEVAGILDASNGQLVFQVLVKNFKFEKQLMEEHFNENYMESDKFPKSDFKGAISAPGEVNYGKDGTYNVTVSGKLTIHGVTKDVQVPGTVVVEGAKVKLAAKFGVKLADYNVAIPSLVADKVAKDASIVLDAELMKK